MSTFFWRDTSGVARSNAARLLGLLAVFFACGALIGMSLFAPNSLLEAARGEFDEQRTYDFILTNRLGFAPEDLQAIEQTQGVEEVSVPTEDTTQAFVFMSMPEGFGYDPSCYETAAKDLSSALTALGQERSALVHQQMISEQQTLLNEASVAVQSAQQEKASFQSEYSQAKTQYDDFIAQYDAAKEKVDSLTLQQEQGQQLIADAQTAYDKVEKDIKGQISALEKDVNAKWQAFYAMRREYNAAVQNGTKNTTELTAMRLSLNSTQADCQKDESQADSKIADLNKELNDEKEKLAELKKTSEDLPALLQTATNEYDLLAASYDSKQQAMDQAQAKMDGIEQTLSEAQIAQADAQTALDALSSSTESWGLEENAQYAAYSTKISQLSVLTSYTPLIIALGCAMLCLTSAVLSYAMAASQQQREQVLSGLGVSFLRQRLPLALGYLLYAMAGAALGILSAAVLCIALLQGVAGKPAWSLLGQAAAMSMTPALILAALCPLILLIKRPGRRLFPAAACFLAALMGPVLLASLFAMFENAQSSAAAALPALACFVFGVLGVLVGYACIGVFHARESSAYCTAQEATLLSLGVSASQGRKTALLWSVLPGLLGTVLSLAAALLLRLPLYGSLGAAGVCIALTLLCAARPFARYFESKE